MNQWKKWLGGAAVAGMMLAALPASAQTPIKFTLDWVFQGPTYALAKMQRIQRSA